MLDYHHDGTLLMGLPVPSFEYRNLTETPALAFVQEEQLGYWIARAWPVTRVMVFFMGCLAALNRLDVGYQCDEGEGRGDGAGGAAGGHFLRAGRGADASIRADGHWRGVQLLAVRLLPNLWGLHLLLEGG